MTTYRLVVFTPDQKTFDKHFDGQGRVVGQHQTDSPGVFFGIRTVVDYGEDLARCKAQALRFELAKQMTSIEEVSPTEEEMRRERLERLRRIMLKSGRPDADAQNGQGHPRS